MRAILHAMRIVLILMLALPAAAVAQSTAQPAQQPVNPGIFRVVPGLGIGQWTLDGKLAEYIFVMGDSVISEARSGGNDLVFRPQLEEKSWLSTPRIFVVYPPTSDTIWAVGTDDPNARTIDQTGVGSNEQQLIAAYQDPQMVLEQPLRTRTLIYDIRGVAFEFEFVPATGQYSPTAGRVFVFRPGQARAIWRLP
jgi:hypothetical protein